MTFTQSKNTWYLSNGRKVTSKQEKDKFVQDRVDYLNSIYGVTAEYLE